MRGRYAQCFEHASNRNEPSRFRVSSIRTVLAKATPHSIETVIVPTFLAKVPLRMMYLVRRASLRNIILRLRGLALRTPILPVVCNVSSQGSIGAFAGDGAASASSWP